MKLNFNESNINYFNFKYFMEKNSLQLQSSISSYSTKRTHAHAFPEQWYQRHSKMLKKSDNQNLLPQEKLLEVEIAELEARWDGLANEAEKIFESVGAVYDTVRRQIRAFPTEDDNIVVNISYRESISMTRELYNNVENLKFALETAQSDAKTYENLLLNNYLEYLKVRDSWLDKMKKLAEVTDQADVMVFTK
jgi:hypothetical protein